MFTPDHSIENGDKSMRFVARSKRLATPRVKTLLLNIAGPRGIFDRVPTFLADLIDRLVSVIVAGGGTALAAKAAGTNIPIVFTSGVDPIQQGIVTS
jgi:hypothetical protein